jgi:hypothetical protein
MAYDDMTVTEAQREAQRLNEVLASQRDWSPSQVTEWWNTVAHPELGSPGTLTATAAWNAGKYQAVRDLIEPGST